VTLLGAWLRAERVKWHNSWVLLPALLAPLCQTGFLVVVFWFSDHRVRLFQPGFRFWLELNFAAWNLLVMPVVAALVCDLSWEQEREARAWSHLLVQPVPRRVHYLVKLLGHMLLLALSLALLAALVICCGFLLRLNDGLLMGPLPVVILGRFLSWSFFASVAVACFQTWLSMRLSGLWVSLTVGLLGSWCAMKLAGVTAWSQSLPWGLGAQMATVFERWRTLPWGHVAGNLALALVLAYLGTLDFTRRHEPRV